MRKASTSARDGIEAAAPLRVTEIADAALAKCAAAHGSRPSSNATGKSAVETVAGGNGVDGVNPERLDPFGLSAGFAT